MYLKSKYDWYTVSRKDLNHQTCWKTTAKFWWFNTYWLRTKDGSVNNIAHISFTKEWTKVEVWKKTIKEYIAYIPCTRNVGLRIEIMSTCHTALASWIVTDTYNLVFSNTNIFVLKLHKCHVLETSKIHVLLLIYHVGFKVFILCWLF